MKLVGKILVWLFLIIFTLLTLLFLYVKYLEMTFDTENMPKNHGMVKSKIYYSNGANKPLIVGFGGSEGGNAWSSDYWEEQRNRFKEQGFSFLAIGYFGMEGTPNKLDRISLDAIHDEIQKYAADDKINGECIALIGGSKGAELVLALASNYKDYKAVVGLVPGNAIFPSITDAMITSSFTLNGKQLPFVPVPWSAAPSLLSGDLRKSFELMLEDQAAVEKARIPVEAIEGPILLISATKDEMWPSKEMSEDIMRRLEANDFVYPSQHIAVEGGHNSVLGQFRQIEDFLRKNLISNEQFNCNIR